MKSSVTDPCRDLRELEWITDIARIILLQELELGQAIERWAALGRVQNADQEPGCSNVECWTLNVDPGRIINGLSHSTCIMITNHKGKVGLRWRRDDGRTVADRADHRRDSSTRFPQTVTAVYMFTARLLFSFSSYTKFNRLVYANGERAITAILVGDY